MTLTHFSRFLNVPSKEGHSFLHQARRGCRKRGEDSKDYFKYMANDPSVRVIDSHTAGESTQVVIDGGPELGRGPLMERLKCFRERYNFFRSGV
jgi:hypothetical protein